LSQIGELALHKRANWLKKAEKIRVEDNPSIEPILDLLRSRTSEKNHAEDTARILIQHEGKVMSDQIRAPMRNLL
jgi:hypothetical protein